MSTPKRRQAGLFPEVQDAAPVDQTAPHLTEWAPQDWPVADDWRPLLRRFLNSQAGQALGRFMRERLASGALIYPPQPFRALALTPLAQVRVVILGQDPYHDNGQVIIGLYL